MTDLHHQLVICSAESCLGSPARWLSSDLAAIKLYQMLRHQIAHPDLLQARLSSFTPNARVRLRLYPLIPKV